MKRFTSIMEVAGTLLAIAGCREEGAMEKAGREVDEAVEKLQHGDEGTLERVGRKLAEALEEDEDPLEIPSDGDEQ